MKSTGIRDLFSFSMWVNFLSRVTSHKLRNCLLVVFTAFQLTTFKYNNVSVYYCRAAKHFWLGHSKKYPGLSSAYTLILPSALTF